MYKLMFIILITIFFVDISKAQSFEDGFVNRMTKQKVRQILNGWNFDFLQETDDSITCYDKPNKRTYRLYQFLFCNNKLYYFRKDFKPSMKNFILIFDKLSSKYGNKIEAYSSIDVTSSGETRSIVLLWDMILLRVKLHYSIFQTNDEIFVEYETSNDCDKQ